jgi:4,5-dihydroxyphthalate decarboxylase
MALRLKTTCAPNPRIQPLVDGEVPVKDIEFDWNLQPVPMLFRNNIDFDDLELSEMSISETLLTQDVKKRTGQDKWNWWALPIYLSRGHFWTMIQANAESGITDLSQLKGRKVGVPDYCMTAALWMKVTLKDLYGIEASDIQWYNCRPREESQAVALKLDEDGPPGVEINWLSENDDAVAMLERGELDAAIGLNDPRMQDNPKLRKLLPDNGKQLLTDYYARTGCFQVNHHFIVQKRLLEGHDGAAMELYNAFEASKQRAYEKQGRSSSAYMYFPGDPDEQAKVFGADPYPMGLKAMQRTLDRLMQGSLEQGLCREPVDLKALYHPSTLGT